MHSGWTTTVGAALLGLTVAGAVHDGPMRTLKATKRGGVVARDADILKPRSHIELDYQHGDSAFEATMKVGTNRPAIALEHIDHLINDLTCSPSGMLISFGSAEHATLARKHWEVSEYIVISSHEGCNEDGQRVPYIVSSTTFPSDTTAQLEAKPASWASISEYLSLDFGTNESAFPGLRKRDGSQAVHWDFSNQTLPIPSTSLKQTCINCAGGATFTIKQGNINLIGQFTGAVENGVPVVESLANKGVGAVTSAINVAASAVIPVATQIANPIITAVQGIPSEITKIIPTIPSIPNPFGDFKKRGEDPSALLQPVATDFRVEIGMSNLDATFEFETDIQLFETFKFQLLGNTGQGLPGFEIPNVVTIGPSVDPVLIFDFAMDQPVSFTYGFTVASTEDASFNIDVLDPASSTASGFDKFNITDIPLQVDIGGVGANFSVAFRPSIQLGINALMLDIDPVVVFADLPKYGGFISVVESSDDQCQPQAVGSNHISFESGLDIDVGVGANLNIMIINANPSATLYRTTGLLPVSTCFDYGAKTTTAVPIATGVTSAASTIASGAPYGNGTTAIPSGTGTGAFTTAMPTGTDAVPTGTSIAWATDMGSDFSYMPMITDLPDWASGLLASASALDALAESALDLLTGGAETTAAASVIPTPVPARRREANFADKW